MNIRKIFHKLLSIEEAIKIVEDNITLKPLGFEEVNLTEAYGRVLAEDVIANIDLPPFDRATMDGYAVKAEETYGAYEDNPVKFRVIGKIEPGEEPKIELNSGEAIEVSTGAPIPIGANAVVMVEYTRRVGDNVFVYKPVGVGENIAQAGSDLMLGETIMRTGEIIGVREIGVLAALGRIKVKVYRKPKVAIISTGNELTKPGTMLSTYKIYDVNTYSISSSVIEDGGIPVIIGVVEDDENEIKSRIMEAMGESDLILISGGTSAGIGDLVYRVLDGIGSPGILIHGLKTKPGKPTIIAIVNGKLIIGLPGWPVSALMIYNLIVKPIIAKLTGRGKPEEWEVKVKIARRVKCERGRANLIPISIITNDEGRYIGYPLIEHSGAIATLKRADGYIVTKDSTEYVEEGEEYNAKLFSKEIKIPDATIIGSHCPALEEIVKNLERKGYRIKLIPSGSTDGLIAVMNGEADMAGIHILDDKTIKYNTPILEEMKVKNAVLVRGYRRLQGLIVAKGNPKRVNGVEDLLRGDVRMINRNRGSGTRILLDYLLNTIAEKRMESFEDIKRRIRGYNVEAKTHSSVAIAIKYSRADVGMGIKTVAIQYDLDFIPLKDEEYDFIISKGSLGKRVIKEFINILKSEEFKSLLKSMGMEAQENIGEVIWEG
jgi:putative molybdopterin biosynthesis protein